jgi:hypothetical protein
MLELAESSRSWALSGPPSEQAKLLGFYAQGQECTSNILLWRVLGPGCGDQTGETFCFGGTGLVRSGRANKGVSPSTVLNVPVMSHWSRFT